MLFMKETVHVSPALPASRRGYFGAYGSDKTCTVLHRSRVPPPPSCLSFKPVPSFHVTRRSSVPPPHMRPARTPEGQRVTCYWGQGHPQSSDLPSDDGAAPAAQTGDNPSNFPAVRAGKAALIVWEKGAIPTGALPPL